MILFILNVHSSQIHRDRKCIRCLLGALGEEEWVVTVNGYEVCLWNKENVLELGSGKAIHLCKYTEIY